jgi:hypothetical protein
MNRTVLDVIGLAGLALQLVTGCSTKSISTRPYVAVVARAPKPETALPVKVGITRAEQDVSRDLCDIALEFSNRLRDVCLFEEVYYPLRSTDVMDATMELKESMTFQAGIWEWETFKYNAHARCTLKVMRGAAIVNTYTVDVKSLVSTRSPASAAKDQLALLEKLWSRLIEKMVADRASLIAELGVEVRKQP